MSQHKKRAFEFLPLTIRLETKGGVATPLVLRGTPLPATRSEIFTTAEDDQNTVEITLLMGESPLAQGNRRLGSFKLSGIPSGKAGQRNVKVEFAVDKTSAILAKATLEGLDLSAEQAFESPDELTDGFIKQVVSDAESSRDSDEAALRTIEATNRAKKLLASAEQNLAAAPDSSISEAVAALGLALASGDSDSIREKSDALDALMAPFATLWTSGLFGETEPFAGLFGVEPPRKTPSRKASQQKRTPRQTEKGISSSAHISVLGKVFGGGAFTLDTQLCFVLMPLSKKFQPVYEHHVRPTVERAGLRCERADEIHGASVITWDIWERINRARVLLAELTDRNANVFYELGLAHAISKDVVLLTQSMDFVPFDLRALRCIVYDLTDSGMAKLEKTLSMTIEVLLRTG